MESTGTEYDSHTLVVNASLRQTLRLRTILVSYTGPSTAAATTPPPPTITLAAPTLADSHVSAGCSARPQAGLPRHVSVGKRTFDDRRPTRPMNPCNPRVCGGPDPIRSDGD